MYSATYPVYYFSICSPIQKIYICRFTTLLCSHYYGLIPGLSNEHENAHAIAYNHSWFCTMTQSSPRRWAQQVVLTTVTSLPLDCSPVSRCTTLWTTASAHNFKWASRPKNSGRLRTILKSVEKWNLKRLSAEDPAHRILSFRDPRGCTMPRGAFTRDGVGPGVSLGDDQREYRRKMDAATRCSGVCSPYLTWP